MATNPLNPTVVYTTPDGIGRVIFTRTSAEILAGITPVSPQYAPGGLGLGPLNVFRFMTAAQIASAIAEDGIMDHTAAIQAANDFLEGGFKGITAVGSGTSGSGYVPGTYLTVSLTGGTGSGATANIIVGAGGNVTGFTLVSPGTGYAVGDVLSANNASLGGSGSGFSETVTALQTGRQPHPGGDLFFPIGLYNINSGGVRIGGHVRWLGENRQNTTLNFNDTNGTGPAVTIGPDLSGLFAFSGLYTMYSAIENFRISMQPNNVHQQILYSNNMQDGSYIKYVTLFNVNQQGISINGFGDMVSVSDFVIYGGTLDGLPLARRGVQGGIGGVLAVRNWIIAGQAGHKFEAGIRTRGGGFDIASGMAENCTDIVACLDTDAPAQGNIISIKNTLGTGNCVNNVHIGAGFPSVVACMGIGGLSGTSGAPIAIKNDNNGESIPNTLVGSWSYGPSFTAPGAITAFTYSALHNTPHIRYGKSATQAIAQSTNTTLTFPTSVDDWLPVSLSEWNTGTGVYTPKVPGRYRVTLSVKMASAAWVAGNIFQLNILKNGALFSSIISENNVGTFPVQLQLTDTVNCVSGDTISTQVFQNAQASINTDNSTNTCFIAIDRE